MKLYGNVNGVVGHKCDTCGKSTLDDVQNWIPIYIEFGYGSDHDEESYDFCCFKCLNQWILNNNKEEA
jgi:hypothetical protein